jgi:hypothetical protein
MTGKVVSRFFCAVEFEQFGQGRKSWNLGDLGKIG